MRKVLMFILIFSLLGQPVYAMEFSAPQAPKVIEEMLPEESSTFWKDLLWVLKSSLETIKPEIAEAASICLKILVVTMLLSLINNFTKQTQRTLTLIGTLVIGTLMLQSVNTMAGLGSKTITELSEYGKLVLPVMSAAMAAQGNITTSTALYAGTALFSSVLTSMISKLLIPVLYVYLCVCVAFSATCETILLRVSHFIKWILTWSLKIMLYVFTGYMTITGVISGSADASAIKATKLAINGAVPIIGNILSDASETILISAGLMKNSVGTYGLIVFTAILIGPFIKISIQYLLLKFTAAVSEVFVVESISKLINNFSTGMGFLLAMVGTVCLLLLISVICFMKGVS